MYLSGKTFIKVFFIVVFLFANVFSTISFSNETANIQLRDSNSKIKFGVSTVNGWQDRSLTKKVTGRGLGDYNLVSYSSGDNVVTYADAPTELVFDNSNAIVRLNLTSGTLPINNSNAIVQLNSTVRTNSNAFAYGIKNNSNAIAAFTNNVKIYDTQQVYSSHTTIDSLAWYTAGFDVYPGKILALKTPIAMSGQISLAGTLTLSSDLFFDAGTTFSSNFGFGKILGNDNAVHLNGNLTIPSGHFMRIGSNLVLEGNGNTLLLGENAQLFVDDNVTLTLRNVVVKSSKNGAGNPAIKLASDRSKLALDNSRLNLSDDFYFDRGQLFAYNDVNISGTNPFIYRSTVQSYIKSGANLKFNSGTTFDYRPSTTGTPALLGKDLLFMDDATSKITLDGATLKSTLTGIRLTKGQVLFDNRVSLTSQSQFALQSTGTWVGLSSPGWINSVNLSSDGRFLAVGGSDPGDLRVYSINGSSLSLVASQNYGTYANSINWSPDGKYLAVAGESPGVGNGDIEVYKFENSSLYRVASQSYGDIVNAVNWSPDGKYLAVGGSSSAPGHDKLEIYSFNGSSLTLVTSQNNGALTRCLNWSPDGRHLAASASFPTGGHEDLEVYSFTGSSLLLVATQSYGPTIWSVNWSPDGRYLAIGGASPDSGHQRIELYTFSGSSLNLLASEVYGTSFSFVNSVNWSPDGRYFAIAGHSTTGHACVEIFRLVDATLSLVAGVNSGFDAYSVNWSCDGKLLAVGGGDSPTSDHQTIEVYTLQYGPETQLQDISNSIVFGNVSAGSASDINLKLLSGANVVVDGILNYDNVNSTSIFSNDNARFVLKDSNSKIRVNPVVLGGWQDRSLIKNELGVGQGDYNLQSYAGADKVVTFAEAPGELVYNNSNAILTLSSSDTPLVINNSNSIKYLSDHFISINNGKLTVLGAVNGSTNVDGRGFLSSPINLQGGTLTLNSDMILSNQTTINATHNSLGNFDLQGNAMIFGGDLELTASVKIVSSGVLDGQGNELRLAVGGKLIIDNGVTLTLRNLNWLAAGSPQVEMLNANSKLTLQNVNICFDRDFTFPQGQLFISDDVIYTGSSKFSYASTETAYIAPHSILCFDKGTTFSYSPRLTGRHALSERDLIKLADKTSEIYFNDCTLQLPDSGWRLTRGTIYFDNKVFVNAQANQSQSFEWGNGVVADNLAVAVLAGADLDTNGYIYNNEG